MGHRTWHAKGGVDLTHARDELDGGLGGSMKAAKGPQRRLLQNFSRRLGRKGDHVRLFLIQLAVSAFLAWPAMPMAAEKPRILAPDVILADPGETIDITIAIAPERAIPSQALVRIKGLPPRISLNAGYLVTTGTWAVPINALASLKATFPEDVTARSEITITLTDVEGRVHVERQIRLIVARTGAAPTKVPAQVANIDIPKLAMPAVPTPRTVVRPSILPNAITSPATAVDHTLPALSPASNLAMSNIVRLELEQLLADGDRALLEGDVAFARRIYRHVTERGLGLAAIKMAETFDPIERHRLSIADHAEDESIARAWYRRAADLGERRALERLQRLERR